MTLVFGARDRRHDGSSARREAAWDLALSVVLAGLFVSLWVTGAPLAPRDEEAVRAGLLGLGVLLQLWRAWRALRRLRAAAP